jgi:tetratricopeptide (TPR) repeat protein
MSYSMGSFRGLVVVCFLMTGVTAWASEPVWLGAEAALESIRSAEPVAAPVELAEQLGVGQQLVADIEKFKGESGGLEAGEAALRWLGLLDRLLAMEGADESDGYGGYSGYGDVYGEESGEDRPTFRKMIEALPGPASWEAIREGIDARPKPEARGVGLMRYHLLRVWGSFMVNDGEGVVRELGSLSANRGAVGDMDWSEYKRLRRQLTMMFGEGEVLSENEVAALEKKIAKAEAGERVWSIDVPDLVGLVGERRAEPLLGRVLVLNIQGVDFEDGAKTKALARRIALERIEALKYPRWGLIDTIDAVALYEAMALKFLPNGGRTGDDSDADWSGVGGGDGADGGELEVVEDSEPAADKKDGGVNLFSISRGIGALFVSGEYGDDFEDNEDPYESWEYAAARRYYVLGLIAAGRAEDARRELKTPRGQEPWELEIGYGGLRALDEAGYTAGVYEFLHLLLTEDPGLPVWDAYAQIAVRLGKSEAMLELATASVAREDLSGEVRKRVRGQLAQALLAADRLEDALGMMREELSGDPMAVKPLERMIRIGIALGDEALIAEAIPSARRVVLGLGKTDRSGLLAVLMNGYIQTGRLAEAEGVLVEFVGRESVKGQTINSSGYGRDGITEPMQMLGLIYGRAGRHEDVLALLDGWDGWGVKDLIDLSGGYGLREVDETPLALYVARALHAGGRSEEAEVIVMDLLNRSPGLDGAYELLIDIRGVPAEEVLDSLFERDQFQERPLIWKAVLQLEAGRVDEAEVTIRRAIAIDPSDGEQGRGDRMRAYRVLGRVAEAKGDLEKVAFLKGVDDAIRLSEDADRVYAAGLLKRGVQMYRESLGYFSDAYCIQSRLAIQLSQMGLHEEAEAHYRRAYELMPDSFGRIESHCFGCEGVFNGERAMGVAERVFAGLVKERPTSPQVHYLLGYLRSSQDQEARAVVHYRRAVELDPEYLNAWKALGSSAKEANLPAEVRDEALLNLVRLDPLGRHTYDPAEGVIDLRALWPILEANQKFHVKRAESLYPLAASAKKQAAAESLMGGGLSQAYLGMHRYSSHEESAVTPGEVLANHDLLSVVAALIDQR